MDRFWTNERGQPTQILASHRDRVMERANAAAVLLAIQDTTDLNFSGLQQTSGLGLIHQSQQQGIKVYRCFAVSDSGAPLGLLHQHTWTCAERTGKRGERRKKATREKESQRWLDTLTAAEQGLDETVCLMHVGDREADIYDLFVQPRRSNSQLLIRGEHNRKVRHELDYLLPAIEQAPVLGQQTLTLERNPERPARSATLTVRGLQVTMEVPRHHKQPKRCQPVTLNVLLVEEANPPSQGKPIRWLLLTTLPIDNFEQAWQCVQWYSLRWFIERFHFTLKSGCRLEQLQLETAQCLLKALATYSIVAWRLMWLTYCARLSPDDSYATVLEPAEWKLLRRKFAPKNRSKKPPTIRQAVRWIAQLGGFLARKGDGEPGLKTLWRGIRVLHHLLEGAQLTAKA
ncbi:MAG: IS4 family transposase (plasmid) [Leptolyngbya sp. BL-A-14]